jgi:hypothetical protein
LLTVLALLAAAPLVIDGRSTAIAQTSFHTLQNPAKTFRGRVICSPGLCPDMIQEGIAVQRNRSWDAGRHGGVALAALALISGASSFSHAGQPDRGLRQIAEAQCVEGSATSNASPNACSNRAASSKSQFHARFETRDEFYKGFVYFVGNHCDQYSATTCRIERLPSHVDHKTSWHGDHSMACEAPTTSREIRVENHDEYFWWCAPGDDPSKGHVMTAQNTTGYGIIAFSPDQDFSDVRKVCWDINSTDLGGGKWTNVIVIPASEYPRHPNLNPKPNREGEGPYRLDYTSHGFNASHAPGDFNVQVSDLQPGNSIWGLKNFRGVLQLFRNDEVLFNSGMPVVTSDKAARYTHCFYNNPDNSLSITRKRPDGRLDRYVVRNAQIPSGKVRVIFQDDNYDPPKRDGYNPRNLTWHWDNILVE